MDKIATNNFIVTLRKDAKASKSMVAGNLTRKIMELKKKLETLEDAEQKGKIEAKINKIHGEIKLLKTLDVYPICKSAILKPDAKFWETMISDSKALPEDILKARVISKGKIQKQVAKFRSEHKDCDEWLEEYFEFREKKRELTEVKKAQWKPRKHTRPDGDDAKKSGKFEKPHGRFNRQKRASGPRGNMDRDKPNNFKRNPRTPTNPNMRKESHQQISSSINPGKKQEDSLHPSWASKRREKELLKAALGNKNKAEAPAPNRVVYNKEN